MKTYPSERFESHYAMLAEAILVHGEIGYKFCWLLPFEDWIRRWISEKDLVFESIKGKNLYHTD